MPKKKVRLGFSLVMKFKYGINASDLYPTIPSYAQHKRKFSSSMKQENSSNFYSLLNRRLLTYFLPSKAGEMSLSCRILFLKTLPIYICFTSQKNVTFPLMQHLTKTVSETCYRWGLCFSLAMFWLGSVLIRVPSLWDYWKLSLSIQFPNNPRIQAIRDK